MVSGPKRLTKQIGVRMEPELVALLEADAKAHERTMAQSVRWHVKDQLRKAGVLVEEP